MAASDGSIRRWLMLWLLLMMVMVILLLCSP